MKHIRNVPWEYGSIIPDYVMGKANCALFLRLVSFDVNYPFPSRTGIYPILKTEKIKINRLRSLLIMIDTVFHAAIESI